MVSHEPYQLWADICKEVPGNNIFVQHKEKYNGLSAVPFTAEARKGRVWCERIGRRKGAAARWWWWWW